MTSLNGALPETVAAFDALQAYMAGNGVTISIANYGGVRTLSDTTQILKYRQDDFVADVNAGRIPADTSLQHYRPISPYGSSFHNYGAAFDIAITARPSGMSEGSALSFAGAYAPQIGLRWGGTFRPNPDYPHFELAISLATARQRYAAMTGGSQSVNTSGLPDISSLLKMLPSLTPTTAEDAASMDYLPDPDSVDLSGMSTDDSGEGAMAATAPLQGQSNDLLILGLFIAGAMAWALKRKFF